MRICIRKKERRWSSTNVFTGILKTSHNSEDMHITHKIFNEDQITALRKKEMSKSTKFMKWSSS
ncbi:unnamed protein product, partial [Tenebrio molitor]